MATEVSAGRSRSTTSWGARVTPWLDRALLPALNVGLVVLVAPPLSQPFSTPKLWWLLACALVAVGLALRSSEAAKDLPRSAIPSAASLGKQSAWPLLLALGWLTALLLSSLAAGAAEGAALARDAAAAVLIIALLHLRSDAARTLRAIAAAGALLASVVLVQRAGFDPFGAHLQGRLRLYGTLGNPDFAAAWLGAALPLTIGEAAASWRSTTSAASLRARWLCAAAAVQLLALIAIGSLATLLALGAAAVVFAASRRPRVALLSAATLLAAALGAASRDPSRALQGRIYLHAVALPHLLEAPLVGHGPGSVRLLWPAWEAARSPSAAEVRFAASQDHVHDDWLERALELGVPAALCLAALAALGIFSAIRLGRSQRGPAALRTLAAGAALAGLCARAFVDFPLARPAELGLFATLIALALAAPEEPCSTPEAS